MAQAAAAIAQTGVATRGAVRVLAFTEVAVCVTRRALVKFQQRGRALRPMTATTSPRASGAGAVSRA